LALSNFICQTEIRRGPLADAIAQEFVRAIFIGGFFFSGTYKNYAEGVYRDIRKETYGEDIGQTSWLTADE